MWLFFGEEEEVLPAADTDLSFKTALPAGFTLSRSEAMLGRSPTNGRWISHAPNVPRFDIDPITRESRGVLVEPARQQIVFKTMAPGYTNVRATTVTDATVQTPFGLGALKLTPDATVNSIHGFNFYYGGSRSLEVPDGSTIAVQYTFKLVGAFPNLIIVYQSRDGAFKSVSLTTLNGGSIISSAVRSASLSADTDGFWTFKSTFDVLSGTAPALFSVSLANASGSRSITGDGTSHLLTAYLGTELATEVTTPILSNGTVPVNRVAESLIGQAPWISDGAASFGVEYIPRTLGDASIIEVSTGGSNTNALDLVQNNSGLTGYYVNRLGTNVCASVGPTPATGVPHVAVLTMAGDDFRGFIDGSRHTIDSNGGIPLGLNTISFGGTAAGASRGPVTIGRLKYWTQSLTDFMGRAFSGDLSIEGVKPEVPLIDMQSTLTVLPADNSVTITLVLEGSVLPGSQIDYRTIDGTAKAGVDYAGGSGTLFIPAGQSTAEITILLGDRSLVENRSFTLELTRVVNATLDVTACQITLNRIIQQGSPATSPYDFGASLPADFLLTRASAAWARNSSGIWTSVATNAPRIHYHAPGINGLLLEGAAGEQRLYDSVDPGLTAVAGTKTIVTSEQTATGTRQLRWRKSADVGEHKLTGQFGTAVADMPTSEMTIWLMVRPVNWTGWKLRVKGIDNVWRESRFDLTNAGSVTATDSGAVGLIERDTFNASWYRIGMNRTQAATAGVTAEFELIPVNPDGTSSTISDITHGIDLCHIQLEPAAGMSSPIIVTGASAKTTRAAETIKADATKTWFKVATFSIGVKFIRLRDQPGTQRVLILKDTALSVTADDIGIQTLPGQVDFPLKVANVTLPTTRSAAATLANGVPTTALMVVDDLAYVSAYHNGGKIAQHAITAGPSAMGVLRLGATEPSGLNPGPVLIQQVYHWNYALPEAEALLFSGNLSYSPGTAPKPVVSIPKNLTVLEGSFIDVQITKSGDGACQIGFRTKQGTALVGADYTGVPATGTYQTVSFLSGETTKTVRVQTTADTTPEPAEDFAILLALLDDSCTLGNAAGTVTILEAAQVMVPAAASATEGQPFSVTITKTGVGPCSIDYRTRAQTATLGDDYVGVGVLTATFAENETSKVIPITVISDGTAEQLEYFDFELSNPVGCILGNSVCRITILDPGETPPPTGQLYTTPSTFASVDNNNVAVDFGIGQTPYYVTSLEDTNVQGTLRHAMSAGNRLVLFEVGGVIKVPESGIRCSADNITIAGETAPSPGITIQGGEFKCTNAQNLCVRHIHFERGYDDRQEAYTDERANGLTYVAGTNTLANSNGDVVMIEGGSNTVTKNVWFDHCSMFWGNDENVQLWNSSRAGVVERISFTNCLISEGMYNPRALTNKTTAKPYRGHYDKGVYEPNHNYGFLIGPTVYKVDVQYCVISDMYWRNIWIDCNTSSVVTNHLIFNCKLGINYQCQNITEPGAIATIDGILCLSGPDTGNNHTGFKFHNGGKTNPVYPPGGKFYVKNLYAMRGAKETYKMPITQIVGRGDTTTLAASETAQLVNTRPIDLPVPAVALSDTGIYDRACLNVGPRPKERAMTHVARKIGHLKAKDNGKFINHESEVGGLSNPAKTTRNLRDGTGKFKNGDTIDPFPTATNKPAVRAWLRKFLDELQYD